MTSGSIQRVYVDIVEDYKYIRVHIDKKLNSVKKNTAALYTKGQESSLFSEAAEVF